MSLAGRDPRRLARWRETDHPPRRVAILSTDDGAALAGESRLERPVGAVVSTATVTEPSDLTGIGVRVNQCLSVWADAPDPITVCFDSVTPLLQYGDVRRPFRFLTAMTTRVRRVGAVTHYHVDPGAHDEWTLATIANVFREVFEYDPAADAWRLA